MADLNEDADNHSARVIDAPPENSVRSGPETPTRHRALRSLGSAADYTIT